jgi:hypothetical protein
VLAASAALRAAYQQQLAGKGGDVRAAETAHQEAVRKARQAARQILESDGAKASDPVMTAIAETLDALPGEETPGRLTRPLQRMGFEALQGVTIAARPKTAAFTPREVKKSDKKPAHTDRMAGEAEQRELAMARERLRFAEAAERETEAVLDRARRAAERASRTRERLEQELAEAADTVAALAKEEAAARTAHAKAVAERERLAEKLPRR